jgi:hypothetical protein
MSVRLMCPPRTHNSNGISLDPGAVGRPHDVEVHYGNCDQNREQKYVASNRANDEKQRCCTAEKKKYGGADTELAHSFSGVRHSRPGGLRSTTCVMSA